jgi:hypothetical protein
VTTLRLSFQQVDHLDTLAAAGACSTLDLAKDSGRSRRQTTESIERLAASGLVEPVWRLTEAGRAALRERLEAGIRPGTPRTYPTGRRYLGVARD